jgi:hypothetical protein
VRRELVGFLLASALLVGCGESPSEQEREQEAWEARTSSAWDDFARAYDSGWAEGCQTVIAKLGREEPLEPMTGCGIHASAEDMLLPPDIPPTDPENEGYELGLDDGCHYAFESEGRDAGACPLEPDD